MASRQCGNGRWGQQGGILDCLRGRIRNQAVCFVRPVVFLEETFPPWGLEEHAEGLPQAGRIRRILHPGCSPLLNLNHGDPTWD
ncbi:hypothetical protein NQZ68_037829 [Dissostichus eleginoides]|nr:hypothetical protein NQZ68_037829 [Dissostichus eleginoides]